MIMCELARSGYQCAIITSDSNQHSNVPSFNHKYLTESRDGIKLRWVKTLKYSSAKSIRRVGSWLHFEWRLLLMPKGELPKPEVIIVSSLSLLSVLNGFLLKRKYKCPLIFEIRDIWPLTLSEEGGFSRWNPLIVGLGAIERLGYKYSDAVVGTMPNLVEHVEEVLGYPRDVGCVPIGIDLEDIDDVQEIEVEYAEKYIPDNAFVVVHAGSIGISNALDVFLESAKVLSAKNLDIHFLVVGDGDLKKQYQETYGHLPNLTFAPRVPRKMVQSVLKKCDLLYFSVFPSRVWQYGQSLNKVTDYMVAGKPIVASYSGYPSMINEAKCGSFVESGNILALTDEILRYRSMNHDDLEILGLRGRKWILENRSYSVLASNYLQIIESQFD